jgi:hypothetical protein
MITAQGLYGRKLGWTIERVARSRSEPLNVSKRAEVRRSAHAMTEDLPPVR